jgi:asparagine synthase (glutamine-hydrolysing)
MLRPYYRITGDQTCPFAQDNLKNYFKKEWYNDHYVQADPPEGKKDIDELSIFALFNYSLPHQLHSEDRNSMHFSLESRLPYLDHRLVEFCLSVPENLKLRNGTTKYLLRESMREDLPPLFISEK